MGKPTDETLKDLVKGVIKDLTGGGRLTEEEVNTAWSSAVGKRAARHTRPVSLKKSRLVVNVDGSGWLYELTLKKRDILKRLEGRLKDQKVKEIRFRIGEVRRGDGKEDEARGR